MVKYYSFTLHHVTFLSYNNTLTMMQNVLLIPFWDYGNAYSCIKCIIYKPFLVAFFSVHTIINYLISFNNFLDSSRFKLERNLFFIKKEVMFSKATYITLVMTRDFDVLYLTCIIDWYATNAIKMLNRYKLRVLMLKSFVW